MSTSPVFRIATPVAFAAVVTAVCILPFGGLGGVVRFDGDVFMAFSLLALARFCTVIAALDTASSFEGMGSSREVFFSALAEPVLLVCLMALARSAQSMSLSGVLDDPESFGILTALLVSASLFVVMLSENSRIPFDDPNTHLELTMIHEVMVLDHGGPDLALVQYGAALKLWIFAVVLVRVLLPFHSANAALDCLATAIGVGVVSICIGVAESIMARLRMQRIPQLLMGAGALALLGLFFGTGA